MKNAAQQIASTAKSRAGDTTLVPILTPCYENNIVGIVIPSEAEESAAISLESHQLRTTSIRKHGAKATCKNKNIAPEAALRGVAWKNRRNFSGQTQIPGILNVNPLQNHQLYVEWRGEHVDEKAPLVELSGPFVEIGG